MDAIASAKPKKSHLWTRDPHDWYVESPECSRALFAAEPFEGSVYDPACGLGRIVIEARAAGLDAFGSDLIPRWEGMYSERNFLTDRESWRPHNIVCNPPFKHVDWKADFMWVRYCLAEAAQKVALLLPADWHCSQRTARFLGHTPLYRYMPIVPRPAMPPGHLLADYEATKKLKGGRQNFAWYVWLKGYRGPGPFHFLDLKPQRKEASNG